MELTRYRDLLWDFTSGMKVQKKGAQLRVYLSEQEMFETGKISAQTVPIDLPLGWLTSSTSFLVEQSQDLKLRPVAPRLLLELGRKLWDAIPQDAKQPMLDPISHPPCRLKISSDSSAIDDLPWEWLNDGQGQPFVLRPEIRLARSIPIRLAGPPMSVEPPLRVLLVITNPKDERLLDPWREIEAISPRLRTPPYELKLLEEPTWEALVAALRHQQPHIVHYIGHAGIDRGEGNIILHDWQNMTHWISGADLSKALPLTVRLLCLSTCFTVPNYQILGLRRLAHIPASYRLPTVVTNRYPVRESGVQTFWQVFYSSLVDHDGNVNEAFHEAEQAVAVSPGTEADWGSFSLVIRDQSAEVMRLETAGMKSTTKYAEEIRAQLISSLANDLTERLACFGPDASERVQKQCKEEVEAASDLIKKL
jgi:hypothetical protein